MNLVDRVFEVPGLFTSAEAGLAVYGYAVQIWADFSGYSDIALGSALLLGFRLKENFDSPYRAADLAEFWRRWHISLSTWLRDYLFFSLPGNRRGGAAPYANLVVTFVLGGLWHGTTWAFAGWGLIHGAGLAVQRLFESRRPRGSAPRSAWRRALGILVTFHVVSFAWILFRCESGAAALSFLRVLFAGTWGLGNVPYRRRGGPPSGPGRPLRPFDLAPGGREPVRRSPLGGAGRVRPRRARRDPPVRRGLGRPVRLLQVLRER